VNVNIVDAKVSDLRLLDPPQRPILSVYVDAVPVSSEPVVKRDVDELRWTTAKYGPLIEFTAESMLTGDDWLYGELSPAAHFNTVFADGFAPLVDVRVILWQGDDLETLEGYWGMQLRRARNLMKKHDLSWRLSMSDYEGTHGRTAWVPLENKHTCAASFSDTPYTCTEQAIEHTTLSGIDYWFCPVHFKAFNASSYSRRTRTN